MSLQGCYAFSVNKLREISLRLEKLVNTFKQFFIMWHGKHVYFLILSSLIVNKDDKYVIIGYPIRFTQ